MTEKTMVEILTWAAENTTNSEVKQTFLTLLASELVKQNGSPQMRVKEPASEEQRPMVEVQVVERPIGNTRKILVSSRPADMFTLRDIMPKKFTRGCGLWLNHQLPQEVLDRRWRDPNSQAATWHYDKRDRELVRNLYVEYRVWRGE